MIVMQRKALQYLTILSLFISLDARGQLFVCTISGLNQTPAVEATCASTFNGPFLTYQANPTAPSTYQWEIYPHAPFPNTSGAYIVGSITEQTVQVNPGYNRGSFLLVCKIRELDPPQANNSCIVFVTVQGPIPNDDAPGAIHLTVDAGCGGSSFANTCATQSEDEPYAACKGITGYKTSWFKFIAPPSGNVRISTDYSGGTMGSDSRLALFSVQNVNNYATFSHLACDDDNGVILPGRSVLYATDLIPGNIYYIQVDGKDASTEMGSFCLTVDELTSSMISQSSDCTAGMPLNSVNDNYTGWHSLSDSNGKLIALVSNTSGDASTSSYAIGLNINSGPVRQDPVSLQHYLDRNFQINNPAVSSVNVEFFFLNSELANLIAADPGASLANLKLLKQTGDICNNNFIAANGLNTLFAPAGNDNGTGFSSVHVTTTGLSRFFIYSPKFFLPVKVFLQGAYNTNSSRHKDVTTTWAAILNANALNQPYNIAPFNYPGTEAVLSGFFNATTATTDIVDWVLIELRDAFTPATVITRRAAFIREDGRIVDLDGVSDISFRNVATGNYHLTVHHRNHLGIRTASVSALNGTMGISFPSIYDFSTGQAKAYQNSTITSNAAMKDFPGGVFGLWGANVNGDGSVRATGLPAVNDYLFLINSIGGSVTSILSNVYNNADMNMDGQVRITGLPGQNDYSFLIDNVLGFDPTKALVQHQ